MNKGMTLWQILTTPIAWSRNGEVEDRRRMEALARRHAALTRDAHGERRRLLNEIQRAASANDTARLARSSRQLVHVVRQAKVLDDLARYEVKDANVFVFSSWTLRNSFFYCTPTREEGMHFVLGIERDGYAMATTIVPFEYAHRSLAGAAGELRETHRVCIEAHESNHRILALIHSHPGRGIHANHHSATDEATQRLWERTTRMIGGIWSRDGYLRWYSCNLRYEVQIVGNHLERIDDNVWKLRTDQSLGVLPRSTEEGKDMGV